MEKPKLTTESLKRYYQGIFTPKHPEKYVGDLQKIIYRSGLEKRFYKWLDEKPSILHWSSEEITIRYFSPVDKREHTYFPDLFFEVEKRDGTKEKYIAEIKPLKQTIKPKPSDAKSKKRLIKLAQTWVINQAKWTTAKKWAEKRKCKFLILTEKSIRLKNV